MYYNFFLLLAYKDLAHRRNERERMWEIPGWDDCVAATCKFTVFIVNCRS